VHKEDVLRKTRRKRFTPEQREKILNAAKDGKMTAKQVQAKHGVSMVTYYLWRRKAGIARPRGTGRAMMGRLAPSKAGLEKMVRSAVRERIQAALPGIVRDEVYGYLNKLLAKAPGRRQKRTV
jgi:transposase-like protein